MTFDQGWLDGDFFARLIDEYGDRARGCEWDESVCTDDPRFRIVAVSHDDASGSAHNGGDVQLFCARHYATELARLVEVHLPDCPHPASAHVAAFGVLED